MSDPASLHNIDWQNAVYGTGLTQSYSLAFRGGIGFYVAYKSIIHPLSISPEMQKPVLYIMLAVPGILTWLAFLFTGKKCRLFPKKDRKQKYATVTVL